MASSSQLDLRDLSNHADISMENMSPMTVHVRPSRNLRTSPKFRRINQNLDDSGSGLDSIIAELDTELAKLTDQPILASSQKLTRSERFLSSLRSHNSQVIPSDEGSCGDSNDVESEMEIEENVCEALNASDRLRRNMSQQLPVKHCSSKGTQLGVLLPKYHTRSESKCIRCKDCGIFFSPGAFLCHFHDEYGRREECNANVIQLNIENPSSNQIQLWEDFQLRIRLKSPRKRSSVFTDSLFSKHRRQTTGSDSNLHKNLVAALLDSAESNLSMDDSALPRQPVIMKRERRPSAPGILVHKTVNNTEPNENSSPLLLNRPVIMGSQNRSSFKTNKNTLQKYLPPRISTDSLKLNLRSHGSLRRTSSLNNITNENNDDLGKNPPSWLHENNKHSETSEKVFQNASDKEDPVYILQTAQELISLAASKFERSTEITNEWQERYENEKQQRIKSEERVKNLERLLHEERKQRESLENQIQALKTCID
ncbi:uncharacterized protein LOC102803204 [Saccoglossus kowalevskii]